MTEMYGNRTYPFSRRIYSRPHACYFSHLYKTQDEKDLNALKEILFDVGTSIVGAPFRYCCDLDYLPERTPYYFSQHKQKLSDLTKSDAYKKYLNGLPIDAATAVETIAGHINQKSMIDACKIKPDLLSLWESDIMIDPRLATAEDIFFHAGHDRPFYYNDRLSFSGLIDREAFEATLNWMAKPKNAERIALMFLYSRLAQHFGETNPSSFTFAKLVDERLRASGTTMPLEYASVAPCENKAGFLASKHNIVTDHKCLSNGTWALWTLETVRAQSDARAGIDRRSRFFHEVRSWLEGVPEPAKQVEKSPEKEITPPAPPGTENTKTKQDERSLHTRPFLVFERHSRSLMAEIEIAEKTYSLKTRPIYPRHIP